MFSKIVGNYFFSTVETITGICYLYFDRTGLTHSQKKKKYTAYSSCSQGCHQPTTNIVINSSVPQRNTILEVLNQHVC